MEPSMVAWILIGNAVFMEILAIVFFIMLRVEKKRTGICNGQVLDMISDRDSFNQNVTDMDSFAMYQVQKTENQENCYPIIRYTVDGKEYVRAGKHGRPVTQVKKAMEEEAAAVFYRMDKPEVVSMQDMSIYFKVCSIGFMCYGIFVFIIGLAYAWMNGIILL